MYFAVMYNSSMFENICIDRQTDRQTDRLRDKQTESSNSYFDYFIPRIASLINLAAGRK